jgi:hypothetical protein
VRLPEVYVKGNNVCCIVRTLGKPSSNAVADQIPSDAR